MTLRLEYIPVNELVDEDVPGSDRWWAYVPFIHRALANPNGSEMVPALPPRGADDQDFCAYWFAAFYLLTNTLGWLDPGAGLKAWMDQGRPSDDDRLGLLQAVWGRGNRLDLLAAWLWPQGSFATQQMRDALGLDEGSGNRVDPGDEWWTAHQHRMDMPDDDAFASPAPCSPGGYDMLHLSIHLIVPNEASTSRLFVGPEDDRRAVLVVEALTGWYVELARVASRLPDIGDHSWYVDVVCPSAGWLGTHRRSRKTGLWFAGKHSIHEFGNRERADGE